MRSLNSRLREFGDRLAEITPGVYHYKRPDRKKPPYIMWMEDGEDDSLIVDNHKEEQAISGTVDLYTLIEYDPAVDGIQNMLNETAKSWKLSLVQHEDTTNLIHHHWEWVIL